MLGDILWIILHSQQLHLLRHVLSVFGFHKDLGGDPSAVDVVIAARLFYIPGVEKVHPAVLDQG